MAEKLMTIPLSSLRRSAVNVRKTDLKRDLDELAASIAAHGLLQNLTV
ncbi:MAG: ParB/RepB/Spo0J family partition protein, partial [Rhodospirillaceae bacterium]